MDDFFDPEAEAAAEQDAHGRRRTGRPRAQKGKRQPWRRDHVAISATAWARDASWEIAVVQQRRCWQVIEDALILYRSTLIKNGGKP